MTTPSSPADLFRFVSLRHPQLPAASRQSTGFIRYADFGSQPGGPAHSQLYEQLANQARLGGPNVRTSLAAIVDHFRRGDAISDSEALDAAFPGFRSLGEWLGRNKTSATNASFQNAASEVLRACRDLRVAAWQVWDSLFSQVIIPDNPRLREDLLATLRLLRLLQLATASDHALDQPGRILAIAEASIVIPRDVAPKQSRLPLGTSLKELSLPAAASLSIVSTPSAINFTAALGSGAIPKQVVSLTSSDETKPLAFVASVSIDPASVLAGQGKDGSKDVWLGVTPTAGITAASLTVSVNLAGLPAGSYKGLVKIAADVAAESRFVTNIPVTLEISPAKEPVTKTHELVISVGGSLIGINQLCSGDMPRDPCQPYQGLPLPQHAGMIKPLGIGDLLVVQQQLLRYDLGEVAHIENVMASETRTRTHRHLRRTQDTFTQQTDTTQETERDTQTAERFTLESETSSTLKSDASLQAGVSISARYGAVKLAANASYATATSQTVADKVSRGYAKEVTQRAASKLTEKVSVQRSRSTLDEFEETNLHGFDNSKGSGNLVGIYRWIDKFFLAQVMNYGKRLMFEFIVPEPAAFYIFAMANRRTEGATLVKPVPPDADGQGAIGKLTSFQDLTTSNYGQWAARYSVQDVPAPPAATRTISMAREADAGDGWTHFVDASMQVPDGYEADSINVFTQYSPGDSYVQVTVAGRLYMENPTPATLPMHRETGIIPIGVRLKKTDLALTITVTCVPSQATFDAWRLKVYSAILAAYGQMASDYEKQLSEMQTQAGFSLRANPPERNRTLESEELKKGCLELLTAQKFEAFDAVRDHQPVAGYPEFDDSAARQQGAYMQFFEQAFEWEQITYWSYPYFWGRKPNWTFIRQYEDADPLFTQFLQAGAARVVVPVHPAYTKAVLHYLESDGEIWNGDDVPTLDDPLYISIVDEMKQADALLSGRPVGAPWEIKVPTALVMLEPDSPPSLPNYTNTLVIQLQSRLSGSANLSMIIRNIGPATVQNATVTAIGFIESPSATFVYAPGLLDPPFVVPGAGNLNPGDQSSFNLNFQAVTGSAAAPFTFVITFHANNMLPVSATIVVP